jgi:hypothetical protein
VYKVEYLNEFGDWIYSSWHKNKDHAIVNAEVKSSSGFRSRIIHHGQIIETYNPKTASAES